MPDITMCHGGNCPMRHNCLRFTAKPTPQQQAYMNPPAEAEGNDARCEHYQHNGSGRSHAWTEEL